MVKGIFQSDKTAPENITGNFTRNINLIITEETGVWTYPVLGLEKALIASGVRPVSQKSTGFWRFLTKALARAGMVRNFGKAGKDIYLAILMGPADNRLFPYSYFRETVIYGFDCWSWEFPRWEAFLRRNRIRLAFFTARHSAEYFSQKIPEMKAEWLPEAVEAEAYHHSTGLEERSIDVLEMGRRDETLHQAITQRLKESRRVHLYELEKGSIVFPTREGLVQGLAESKISVCYPSSITHPERSGEVETVTHRYFESMASGCLLWGKCPQELCDLFGYNPVIEVDERSPYEQLEEILQNLGSYQELVHRNYQRLLEVGTWRVRAAAMLEVLKGYDFSSDH